MSVMKWMRKNNTKLMAVVVIVLMIAFIGGSSFSFLMRGSGGANAAVAYYGPKQKQKITRNDRIRADNEIKLLEELRAGDLLRNQDLRGLLLAELLFSQSRDSAGLMDMARMMIQRNQYRISEKQLANMYNNRTVPSDVFWILLRDEAESAGIHVSNADVGELLGRIVPQLFGGATYAQVMQSLVGRYGVPEDTILAAYGQLLAVLQYAQVISSMEDLTTSQIRHMASREGETLNAEYVQLEASAFANKQQTPSEDAMVRQFNQFKSVIAGDVNEANPFGFGYRLPSRVQLDYIALKLSDVAAIIKPPTNEDAEQYYQQNRAQEFTEKVPSDPNDPNSPKVDKVKSYLEVVDDIRSRLRHERILTKAEQILQEAKNTADVKVHTAGPDGNAPTTEVRAKNAGDYAKVAQDLSSRYSLPLYNGSTGQLSAIDIRGDRYLGRMALVNYGRNPVPLTQVVFSAEEFGDKATILSSMQALQMYVSAGPFMDPMSESARDVSGQIMLIARVVAAEPDGAPADLNVSYSTRTLDLGNASTQQDKTFAVKEQVVKDLETLGAWDTTRAKADELATLATRDGWDSAVTQFNKLYREQTKAGPNEPNAFKLDTRMGVQRISNADIAVLAAQLSNRPGAPIYLNQAAMESRFADRLYSLAPTEPNAAAPSPKVMEFRPGRSYYVIKDLSLQPVNQEQFQRMKGMMIGREEYGQSQSLAIVHLDPDNILKRMNFRWTEDTSRPAKDKAAKESKDAS